jgi:hypothetical protein
VVQAPLLLDRNASAGAIVRGDVRRTLLPVSEFESLVRGALAPPSQRPGRRAVAR